LKKRKVTKGLEKLVIQNELSPDSFVLSSRCVSEGPNSDLHRYVG